MKCQNIHVGAQMAHGGALISRGKPKGSTSHGRAGWGLLGLDVCALHVAKAFQRAERMGLSAFHPCQRWRHSVERGAVPKLWSRGHPIPKPGCESCFAVFATQDVKRCSS